MSNSDNTPPPDVGALNLIINTLGQLDEEARKRILRTANTFFGFNEGLQDQPQTSRQASSHSPGTRPNFTEDYAPSPKEFMLEKQPRTGVERVACLAYYLAHYRNTSHFKTLDLAKLNTEAAQPKFSNAAQTSNDAAKMGYLAPAAKGLRQLSAAGEQFVQALPDREAARRAMINARPRRGGRRAQPKRTHPRVTTEDD